MRHRSWLSPLVRHDREVLRQLIPQLAEDAAGLASVHIAKSIYSSLRTAAWFTPGLNDQRQQNRLQVVDGHGAIFWSGSANPIRRAPAACLPNSSKFEHGDRPVDEPPRRRLINKGDKQCANSMVSRASALPEW
jgi:hypothetical protein